MLLFMVSMCFTTYASFPIEQTDTKNLEITKIYVADYSDELITNGSAPDWDGVLKLLKWLAYLVIGFAIIALLYFIIMVILWQTGVVEEGEI